MNDKIKIAVLVTTFNRCELTVKCIKSIYENNKELDFRFIVTDDNSSDGTVLELNKLPVKIKILKGNGKLFWNGGMRKSMEYAIRNADRFQYALLVNDDTIFVAGAIERLVKRLEEAAADIIVGATSGDDGNMSYGGVLKTSKHFAKFKLMDVTKEYEQCDTFNCNCVLIKSDAFAGAGNLDSKYVHSMGDYDYGMHVRRIGLRVIQSAEYVGHCNDNDVHGSWRDASLSRRERLRLKESPKGLPFKDWFYFVKKNYGLVNAVYHSITPYIKIMIGR